jgi:hypothetical protein
MPLDDYTYILKDRKVVKVPVMEWSIWFNDIKNRRVALTHFPGGHVSTVFLGLRPVYFETMVFGGSLDEYQYRTTSYKQAKTVHARVIKTVRFLLRLKGSHL